MWGRGKVVQFGCYGCGAGPGDVPRTFREAALCVGNGVGGPASVGET